jgi:excisionase family DNA binding protein
VVTTEYKNWAYMWRGVMTCNGSAARTKEKAGSGSKWLGLRGNGPIQKSGYYMEGCNDEFQQQPRVTTNSTEQTMNKTNTSNKHTSNATFNGRPVYVQEPEQFLSWKQAAEALGVCLRTLANYIKSGVIPAARLSPRCVRVRKSDLSKAMDRFVTTA